MPIIPCFSEGERGYGKILELALPQFSSTKGNYQVEKVASTLTGSLAGTPYLRPKFKPKPTKIQPRGA